MVMNHRKMQEWSNKIKQSRERRPELPGKMRIGSFEIMQEIYDFLSGEEKHGTGKELDERRN